MRKPARKDRAVIIRMTAAEKRILDRTARQAGETVAAFVRRLVREAAKPGEDSKDGSTAQAGT